MSIFKIDDKERAIAAEFMRRRYEADKETFAELTEQGVDYALLNDLVADNYSGAVYLSVGESSYAAPTDDGRIKVQATPYTWLMQRFWVQKCNRWGEAIYRTDTSPTHSCWTNQLVNPGAPQYPYVYFNVGGVPDDAEQFHFEYVDSTAGTVRIRDYQDYVYVESGTDLLAIGAPPAVAASFFVQFQQQIDMQVRNDAVVAALHKPHSINK